MLPTGLPHREGVSGLGLSLLTRVVLSFTMMDTLKSHVEVSAPLDVARAARRCRCEGLSAQ